jgi:hypothetical protein
MLNKLACMNVVPLPSKAIETVMVVSGLPRSGTSMLMRLLSMGGVQALTDNVRRPDSRNPQGYFELEAVKERGCYTGWIDQAAGKAIKVISRFLPRLPAIWRYQVLFIHRDIDTIIRSQQDLATHHSRSDWDEAIARRLKGIYLRHVGETLEWIDKRPNMRLHQLKYEDVLAAPDRVLESLCRFAAPFSLDARRMVDGVDCGLNHAVIRIGGKTGLI